MCAHDKHTNVRKLLFIYGQQSLLGTVHRLCENYNLHKDQNPRNVKKHKKKTQCSPVLGCEMAKDNGQRQKTLMTILQYDMFNIFQILGGILLQGSVSLYTCHANKSFP